MISALVEDEPSAIEVVMEQRCTGAPAGVVCSWPLAGVALDRLGTTAIEGTTDQCSSRWADAAPLRRPEPAQKAGISAA
jgi:hypothetical protein